LADDEQKESTMSWVWLAIAIAGDVVGTSALERGSRAHYVRYFILAMVAYLLAFYAFARSLQSIPTSAADAIYFAVSTAIIVAIGVIFLEHRLTARKATALALVVAGVVVLRMQAAGA
jgi:small multidrug resistance pump